MKRSFTDAKIEEYFNGYENIKINYYSHDKKVMVLCDYKRVWDMDMAERTYVRIKEYFRHFDPMHERENEIFMKLGYIDLQNISKRIKAKCMMFTGLMDDICPPSTQFAMYNKITSEKEYKIFYEFGHEYYKEYMYLDMDENDAVFHMMGEPNETRHIIMHNEEAVISPSWSIHSGVGTKNYSFIWVMCGENQEFEDIDFVETKDLK